METKKQLFSVMLDKSDSDKLQAIAEKRRKPKSYVVREWIRGARLDTPTKGGSK